VKIVVVANSQGTPAGGVTAEAAYPAVLARELAPAHECVPYAESGWSIRDFNAHLDDVLAYAPDLVIAQVGIVEASRRILSTREKKLLARVRGSARLTKWLHDRRKEVIVWRARLHIDTRLFSPKEFDREVAAFVERLTAAGVRTLLLETPQFGAAYEREHFPLINDDIEIFNRVLRRYGAVPILSADDDRESIWVAPTVHFDERGHTLAATRIAERLRDEVLVAA
jgi:hypothetical protein